MIKIFIVILIGLALALFFGHSNHDIGLTLYTYENSDVPSAFDGFRITQVSDLQSEYFGRYQTNLIRVVKESKPDIIVFTGDLMDRNHTNYDAAKMAMKKLTAIAPVYYVNGNHEVALPVDRMDKLYAELKDMGVKLLFDTGTTITQDRQAINLLGISEETVFQCKGDHDRLSDFKGDMLKDAENALTSNVSEEDMTILLTHEPQYLEVYADKKIDLIFAGHAHGGQIRLPFTEGLYAPGQGILPKLTNGIHESGPTTMVISRGLGNSSFPFRVFNRPEVVRVTLKKQ